MPTSEFSEDKLILEDMFISTNDPPEYQKGWNDAIKFAIKRHGPSAWVDEREEMLGELATLRQQLEDRDALLEAAEQVITKVESNIKLAEAGNNQIGLGWRLAQRDIEAFREMKGE